MAQNRIWWGISALGFKEVGDTGAYTVAHGVQSIGTTTKIDIRKIYEMGQSDIYENYEELPEVQVNSEKVFDGYPILYHLATPVATSASLLGRSTGQSIAAIAVFPETHDSASGTPLAILEMSGLFVQSWGAEFPVDGDCKETVTFIGNNKVWKNGSSSSYGTAFNGTLFDNLDVPPGSGGVQQRENVVFDGVSTSVITVIPTDIPGVSSSGTNFATAGIRGAHVQKISVNADFGREAIKELGQRNPYCRYMTLPVEVKTDIEIIALSGDMISISETATSNTTNQTIRVVLSEGLNCYLGTKNRLNNVQYGGGDTGGGNATITYSYTNSNFLTVTHPADPAGL